MTSYLLSWKMQPFQGRVYSKRKEFAHREQILFFKELIPEMGSKKKRVASPESVPIHLNCGIYVHHLTFIYEHIYHEKNKLESSLCRLNSAGSNTMPVSNSAAAPSIFPIDMLTVKKNGLI